MPGWGEILSEITTTLDANGNPDVDGVRAKYLGQLADKTGRSTVVYASNWLGSPMGGLAASITLVDMQGLMEVFRDLPGPGIDLILHSPGGSAEAADRLVRYTRSKYTDVRVFVPLAAMSASTMWALSADRIVMGKHSQLGPIDPQVSMQGTVVPASALVRQFERIATETSADPSRLSAWLPTLQQYSPGLLEICKDADKLGRSLVEQWVARWMLAGDPDGPQRAKKIADYFADADLHKSHGKAIDRDEARDLGVKIENLEDDQDMQDKVLSVHHATMITFQGPTVKLIENNIGRRFLQQAQMMQMPMQLQAPIVSPQPPPP